jgi:uncharacterized membrane protein YkoI
MFLKGLLDQIHGYEEYVAKQKDELARQEERLRAVEKGRAQTDALLERDHGNAEAQVRLDQNDAEMADLKKGISAHKRRMEGRLRTMRSRLLQAQAKALKNLQDSLREEYKEQTSLKNVLIPEAEHHLASLREKVDQGQERTVLVQREIEKINRLGLDNLLQ